MAHGKAASPMDLLISRPDRFRRILPISAAGDALRVRARSQIARIRALFERFSEISENWRTEWWRMQSRANRSPSTVKAVDTLTAVDARRLTRVFGCR